jgi:hypothetical protein
MQTKDKSTILLAVPSCSAIITSAMLHFIYRIPQEADINKQCFTMMKQSITI